MVWCSFKNKDTSSWYGAHLGTRIHLHGAVLNYEEGSTFMVCVQLGKEIHLHGIVLTEAQRQVYIFIY